MSSAKTNVTGNFLWRFMERCAAQGVTLLVGIILGRLLSTKAYDLVAYINIVITLLQVFVDSGMGNALIQKKDADDLDFSSVFFFNITLCITLYIGVFFAAPYIAIFFKHTELTPLIRVLSLTIIVSGVRNVQQAYVSRTMQFKRFFYATLIGTIVSAVVGITMAYNGFGVWSLIAQNLVNVTVGTIVLWVTVKWRPKRQFSFQRLKGLLSYGWKLLVSSLFDTLYHDLRQLIIGRRYQDGQLAFYNQGKKYPQMLVSNINSSIDSVLLPTMSKAQDNRERVKAMTRRSIKVSSYLIFPMMMGFAVCAEPLIGLLLTDKWLPSVPFMRVFCFTYAFNPVQTANLNAIKAMGRSDMFLKLEIIKKIIGILSIVISIPYGVMAMAYSLLVTSVISMIINSWPNRKLLNYSYLQQLKDMMPQLLLTCFMGAAVYCVTMLQLSRLVMLLIQVPLGVIIYLAGSKIFRLDSFEYVLSVAKGFIKKRNKKEA